MEKRDYIVGTCKEMCPDDEIKMRERECLLHIFEMLPGTETDVKPKADRNRMIKSYIRSGIGQEKQKAEHLRTPDALLETVYYLLDIVLKNDKVPFTKIYDFIVDRLQAVRQDIVIQNLPKPYIISILQPAIRFYAYSAYTLCEEDISRFDPVLNNKQLQNCLKKLLKNYDYYDDLYYKSSSVNGTHLINFNLYERERPYFEALYLLFNLGHSECITRALNIPPIWRTDIVKESLNISLNYIRGNWVQVCRRTSLLPALLHSIIVLHLPDIRRKCLRVMNVGYSTKNLSFPIDILSTLLMYEDRDDLISDCKYYKIHCDRQRIYFLKGTMYEAEKTAKLRKSKSIDAEFRNKNISSILLHGEL